MESLQSAHLLRREGRFTEALRAIGSAPTSPVIRTAADVLRADLLEHVGQHADATSLVAKLLRTNRLTDSERSTSERVLGFILLESGDIDGALAHLQSSAAFAAQAGDLQGLFLAQARIMLVVSERSGPGAATPMLAEVRQLATKLGDPHVTAALHLYVAEMEAKRGLLRNAARHAGIANSILSTVPNLYLEAFSENLALALAVLRSQFAAGRNHGLRAVELSELSGVKSIYRASVANLGNLFYATGDFERAVEFFERALAALPSTGEKTNASLDTLARVRLSQGRLDDCSALLHQIETAVRCEQDRTLYAHRHAELTRAQLLADRGELEAAMAKAESALALATLAVDTLLTQRIHLTQANLLYRSGRTPAAMTVLRTVSRGLVGQPPELYAQSEQIFACAEAMEGNFQAGEAHYKRASRIHDSLGTIPGRMELESAWAQAVAASGHPQDVSALRSPGTAASQVLQGLAAVLAHGDRPGLVAREIVEILASTDCVHSARAVAARAGEPDATVALQGNPSTAPVRTFTLGLEHEHEIRLLIQPK